MSSSNRSFFYQFKILEYFKIAKIGIYIDIIYITKSRKFRFLNIIYITLRKEEMIPILPICIKTFFQKILTSIAL